MKIQRRKLSHTDSILIVFVIIWTWKCVWKPHHSRLIHLLLLNSTSSWDRNFPGDLLASSPAVSSSPPPQCPHNMCNNRSPWLLTLFHTSSPQLRSRSSREEIPVPNRSSSPPACISLTTHNLVRKQRSFRIAFPSSVQTDSRRTEEDIHYLRASSRFQLIRESHLVRFVNLKSQFAAGNPKWPGQDARPKICKYYLGNMCRRYLFIW